MNKKELKQLIDALDISHITLDISQDEEDDETTWLHVSFSGAPKDRKAMTPKAG